MGNGPVAAEELRLLCERIERIEEEIKSAQDDRKDVYNEAKARGFCAKTLKRIVRERKKTVDQRREEEAMFDLYRGALGMLDGTPLGNWAVQKLTKPGKANPDVPQPDDAAAGDKAAPDAPVATATPPAPTLAPDNVTIGEARQRGTDAARAGQPVTANPFPPRSPLRAAWDEAWCHELGSDGMDIPAALRPTPKEKPAKSAADDDHGDDDHGDDRADDEPGDDERSDDEPVTDAADEPAADPAPEPDTGNQAIPRGAEDPVYAEARATVLREQYASTSRIQRAFTIGYNRAAKIIEALEDEGVISPADQYGKRDVLLDEKGEPKDTPQ